VRLRQMMRESKNRQELEEGKALVRAIVNTAGN
jgi:hypothetical protein